MKYILIALFILLAVYLLYQVGLFSYRVHISKGLVRQAHALNREGSGAHMLIVGDSTAVGVGASSPESSIAGLFAKDFPNLAIENRAVSGARLKDLVGQVEDASRATYDILLIQGGPNDVLSFRDLEDSRADAKRLLALAAQKSDHVVFLSGGNIGLVPLLPWPVSELISARTRSLRASLVAESREAGTAYIDLYKKRSEDEFSKDPTHFYAKDGLHPADLGYAFWYARIHETISTAFPTLVL